VAKKYLQFCQLPDPVAVFEPVFVAALKDLVSDLAEAPRFVREHDVVNLFVFRYLITSFLAHGLDTAQIGTEVPLLKLPEGRPREKHGSLGRPDRLVA
jgi:hypothetical protein